MPQIEQCITRTMFCPTCNAHDRPRKGDKFVIYGGTRQNFFVKTAHQDGVRGFSPHIITYFEPFKVDDGTIPILAHCGICDVDIEPQQDGMSKLRFNEGNILHLSERELLSLILNWKSTGYEII